MLDPFICNTSRYHLSACQGFSTSGRDKRRCECALVRPLHIERSRVFLGPHINSPESIIGEAYGSFSRNFDRSGKSRGKGASQVLEGERCTTHSCPRIQRRGESSASLESSVANQFRVEATFTTVVDLLCVLLVLACFGTHPSHTSSITPYCKLVVTLPPDFATEICTATLYVASSGRSRYPVNMMVSIAVSQSMQPADPIQNRPYTTYLSEATANIYAGDRKSVRK